MKQQSGYINVSPLELITWKRFDLLAKYIYAKNRKAGIESDWYVKLYLDHIRVFNGFYENDDSGKLGPAEFLKTFNIILDSIEKEGFIENQALVPVGNGFVLQDGAHRVAACLLHDKSVKTAQIESEVPIYSYQWFKERGLAEKWMDAMATELCRVKKNTFIVVIYPSAIGQDDKLVELVKNYGDVWYRKEVTLFNNGPLNLIRQIYAKEPWLGNWKDGFSGARNKTQWCFQSSGAIRVFLVESDLPRVIDLKKEIRNLYGIENHSVHINDTHDETLQLAGLFFNNNSVHFMNYSGLVEHKWFNRLLEHYKKWLKESGLQNESFCIDGSAVMAAYGFRECRDLDYLCEQEIVDSGYKEIGCHNSEIHHYGKSISEIVSNPLNHFYYDNIKFTSLEVIREIKVKRNEDKDVHDVALIDAGLKGFPKNNGLPFHKKIRRFLSPRYVYQAVRFKALQVRYLLKMIHKRILLGNSYTVE